MKFRKRPVVIEAMQVPPGVKHGNDDSDEFIAFMGAGMRNIGWSRNWRTGQVRISTLEGTMTAAIGDWIIKGIKGEFYACKPDIFAALYDAVVE